MILALDIGNTNIKAGYFLENKLNDVVIFRNPDELFDSIKLYEFNGAAISSVVPDLTARVKHFLEEELKITPYIISKDSLFNLKLDYKTPETLGIDRICSVEAAFEIFNNCKDLEEGTFLLTIDFGTAKLVTIREIVERIARIIGGPAPSFGRIPSRLLETEHRADLSRTLSLTGWQPLVDLDSGLSQTVAWFRHGASAAQV